MACASVTSEPTPSKDQDHRSIALSITILAQSSNN
jgi:hypothetical protein